jgi:EXS family
MVGKHGREPRICLLFLSAFRLLAAAINSLYSFWWDLTNDWGLELLASRLPRQSTSSGAISPPRPLVLPSLHSRSPSGSPHSALMSSHLSTSSIPQPFTITTLHNTHPFGLRSTLLYPLPFYPLIIFLNLILRLTWSIKLSSHLHSHSEGSVVIFWLEMAEMVRRWLWVFVRVEWEVVKTTSKGRSSQTMGNENGHGYEEEEYELQADPEDAGYDTR